MNAANAALSGGGGVDGAIHRVAGPELLLACRRLGRCEPGNAVITPGFDLPARFVIHAVGPVWRGGDAGESVLLERCYARALQLAQEHGLRSIVFPAISCGAYRYPPGEAADVAVRTIQAFENQGGCPADIRIACVEPKVLRAFNLALDVRG